ncbi:MAG: metallophosphoesterase [Parasporobacterium sp.]|nr:metallophosphoesterase [Parasporobacterium sp.]
MIFITGDTHRKLDIGKLDTENFSEQTLMGRSDYLIITGDFGGVWTGDSGDDEILSFHEEKPYTTLFVGGNHENYDALSTYPVILWNKGLVHKVREHVLHLMNGQIYEINGSTFFVMGGATSVDKMFRTEHETWWEQEEPSEEDFKTALDNLAHYGNKVDYIITHTIPEKVRKQAFKPMKDFLEYESRVERFLDVIIDEVQYKKWFAGHIHIDRELSAYNLRILFNSIIIV